MPLPLVFIIPAILSGSLGVGKGIKAGVDMKNAKDTNEQANNLLENEKNNLETHRKYCSKALENLGRKKLYILDDSIYRFITTIEKIKNVELIRTLGLNELSKFRIDTKSFSELKEMGSYASSLLGGTATGALGGALTAFGAWGAATTFASASTGTAIATLSGAAASNATLAFFGGGSLAAGGLGMAGGTVVLGGLVAGPALAVMGFVIGAKASAQKEKAYENLAQAKKISEELSSAALVCDGIRRRCNMFYNLLIRLDAVFTPLVIQVQKIVSMNGYDYKNFSQQQRQTLAATFALAGAIKAVLDTPILTETGNLTDESAELIPEIKEQLKQAKQPIKMISQKKLEQTAYIICKNCGYRESNGSKFCSQCGTKL